MHISHLPCELLVNIIKRLDFDSVGSVLFLNKNFNNLVNDRRLYRPMAEVLWVSVVKSLTKNTLYTISVAVRTPAKWPIGDKRMWKSRKKSEKIKLFEKDKELIEEQLLDMLKKFGIASVKQIQIDHRSLNFDIMDTIQEAGVSMDIVEHIRSQSYIETPFISTKHLEKLLLLDKNKAANKKRRLNFDKCITRIRFEAILEYIEKRFENNDDNRCCHFGVFELSASELNQIEELVDKIRLKLPGMTYSRSINRKDPIRPERIYSHFIRKNEEYVDTACGYVSWQEIKPL